MADRKDVPPAGSLSGTTTARVGAQGEGTSVAILPTDAGSAGTQKPGMETALTVLPQPTEGAVLESPWVTLFERAGRHASTLAMADVAWALTTQHAVGASPPLVICGGALLGIGGILASTMPLGALAVGIMGVIQIGLGLWRPRGWRR